MGLISKTDTSGTRTFARDGVSVLAPITGDGAAHYTPGVSERRGGVTTYQHSGIKSTGIQSDAAQGVVATRRYDAFGNVALPTGSFQGPFGYAGGFGYHADADSGLQQVGHRYYDPSLGRFLRRDPIGSGRNWYVYCGNNPLAYTDPTGLIAFVPALVWLVGAGLTAWSVYDFVRDPTVVNLLGIVPWAKAIKGGKVAAQFLLKVLRRGKLPEKYVGMITDAAIGWKGGSVNFGIRGSATLDEADELGKIFVGPGYTVSRDGSALISADGLRVYRKPSYKKKLQRTQANFETYEDSTRGTKLGNGHLEIDP